jgi:hypothetical protein
MLILLKLLLLNRSVLFLLMLWISLPWLLLSLLLLQVCPGWIKWQVCFSNFWNSCSQTEVPMHILQEEWALLSLCQAQATCACQSF